MNDCVFYTEKKCLALTSKHCKGCAFHKTKDEFNQGRQKAEKRIRSLPQSTQIHILRKYYSRRNRNRNG